MSRVFSIVFMFLSFVAGVGFVYYLFHFNEVNNTTMVGLLVEASTLAILSIMINPKSSEKTMDRGFVALIVMVIAVIVALLFTSF